MKRNSRYALRRLAIALVGCAAGCSSSNDSPGWGDDAGDATAADATSGSEDAGAVDSTVDTGLTTYDGMVAEGGPDATSDAPDQMTPDGEGGADASVAEGSADAVADASAEDGREGSADASPTDGPGDAPPDAVADAGCPRVDAAANLMIKQPDPTTGANFASDWDDSFGQVAYMHMTATTVCGGPGTLWVEPGVAAGKWIKIYPNGTGGSLYYLASALAQGTSYTAGITMTGTGSYLLDVYDGALDHATAPVTLSPSVATTLTQSFTVAAGAPPGIQVRVAGLVSTDVNVTLWDLTITQP